MEMHQENWKTKLLVIGTIAGAVLGFATAFMMAKAAEEEKPARPRLTRWTRSKSVSASSARCAPLQRCPIASNRRNHSLVTHPLLTLRRVYSFLIQKRYNLFVGIKPTHFIINIFMGFLAPTIVCTAPSHFDFSAEMNSVRLVSIFERLRQTSDI